VFNKTGLITSDYQVLSSNKSIVDELGIGKYYGDCTYHGPEWYGSVNPGFDCTSITMFNRADTKKILASIEKILVDKGWQPGKYNNAGALSYNKNDLNIVAEPYSWATTATADENPFLITLSRTTLWKP
jgi:hypothetical protein